MRVAIVHDWFASATGGEKCVESFLNLWPDADVFTLVDFLGEKDRAKTLRGKHPRTSFIQNLPFSRSKYRSYLPFFPMAIESFDLSGYDLILSSSSSVAKGVLSHSDQLHVCYCHTPMRYAWDLHHQYMRESGLDRKPSGILAKGILHYIRMWDLGTAGRVDHFVANSRYVAARIRKIYSREADVINPPVDVSRIPLRAAKEDFYVTVSRLVPYKKVDLIVRAFTEMGKPLVVIGAGPDMAKVKALAGPNIQLLGYQEDAAVFEWVGRARAFLFAADEDFGISPLEANACGTPVIFYGKGGLLETIPQPDCGISFADQTTEAIRGAVERFETLATPFDPAALRRNAERFSRERFEREIRGFVERSRAEFRRR
jgi:glycosyltransferase involved in cell wall biosynthesis